VRASLCRDGSAAAVAAQFRCRTHVLGFVLINGLTFGVDLLLLSGLHAGLRMPIPFAVTLADGCAFTLSYFLNRTMNFASRAPVGPQFAVYLALVLANYLAFILGLSSAMRWAVFRR
jgi:putative flippase GtrA